VVGQSDMIQESYIVHCSIVPVVLLQIITE